MQDEYTKTDQGVVIMWYSKGFVLCSTAIIMMNTVVGMNTFIPIDFSPPALQRFALLEAIEKKKTSRRQRLEKYKQDLPDIKLLLEKCAKVRIALEAFISHISGYDTCQISGVSQLGLDTSLADCIADIDKHTFVKKPMMAESNGIPLEKKLLILRVLNERKTLQFGLEYVRKLIRLSESTLSTSSDSDDTYYSYGSGSDDETPDLAC